jgi:hypothetical protein
METQFGVSFPALDAAEWCIAGTILPIESRNGLH